MKPYEIAAMLSATFDAHEGRLGPGLGIKAIDKGMQVVMPGVTGTGHRNLDIVRMIRLWAQSERTDQRFPADVLNFHGYSTDNQANPGDVGPEGANMSAGLAALVAWRDEYEPALEVWLTEFGFDVAQGSPDRAKQYGPFSAGSPPLLSLCTFLFWQQTALKHVARGRAARLRVQRRCRGCGWSAGSCSGPRRGWTGRTSSCCATSTTRVAASLRPAGSHRERGVSNFDAVRFD
jgi:hypothetical protein